MSTCSNPKCENGLITVYTMPRGYKTIHNNNVRNYRGGRRPRVNDLRIPESRPCPDCEKQEY